MQFLPTIKVFTDGTAGARTFLPVRSSNFGGRNWLNFGDSARNCRLVACSVESNGNGGGGGGGGSSSSSSSGMGSDYRTSSFLSRTQTYAMLKQQMEVAAKSEDYEEAARIRDSLKSFEEEEPVLRLRRLLKDAINEERFEDAVRYRDELKEIAPHSLLKCSSDATTLLLRRHWIITDANGKTENVWGTGVIGEQPVILPRTGFEYSSACPLPTPNGRMEGDFEMKHIDRVGSPNFNVAIAPFSLSLLGDESEPF
ncbi:uncharacterized protein LOC110630887 isoform X2 [Manihot esculenta]|uniref:uncharacterized protein LOC110630887 isoform X2 n=1 Tax=Manihot esculenta TaxID=3983 RepID=UPI000B5D3266|nr:uncharacterized protein LOC110630887 isoform X2 [Manihot esculenta]